MADLSVVGVTGTDGKSTTTHLTESVLLASGPGVAAWSTVARSRDGARTPTPGRLTTPEAPDVARLLDEAHAVGCRWVVLEASSHGLALGRVDAVPFEVGVVTNVTHEHLDFHGSPAAYRRSKGVLVDRVAAHGGTVVVNADDDGAMSLVRERTDVRTLLCGSGPGVDVRAEDVVLDPWATIFDLWLPTGREQVRLPLPGAYNLANALCAAGVGVAAGLDTSTVAAGLEGFQPLPGRMERVGTGVPFEVVVDYAHTPAALEAVLPHLRSTHPDGRIVVVVGSAGERDLLKRPWMGHVAARLADVVVLTVEDPRDEAPSAPVEQMAAGARAAGAVDGATLHLVLDRREAVRAALSMAAEGDCVLLAGKGHERTIAWAWGDEPWDEAAVAREALADLEGSSAGAESG